MEELKAYPEYKDSGVEWIGEIPTNWGKVKLNWLFGEIGSGGTPNSTNENYYINGNIDWVNTGDLNDGFLIKTKKKITEQALQEVSTIKLYPENSLIVAMYGATIGKIAITNIKAATNQACCVLTNPLGVRTKFMFYWFLTNREDIINSASGGGQPNISQSLIKSLSVFFPQNYDEQDAIIYFLDNKTSQIDALIADKERLIKLLEEKRQAVITETVTKGLDPNVKMEDSGVEWIGEIPEHWTVGKVSYAFDIVLGKMIQPLSRSIADQLVPYLKANNIQDGFISYKKRDEMFANPKEIKRYELKRNDLLVCEGGEVARSAFVEENLEGYIFQNALHRVRGTDKGDARYLHYLLNLVRSTGFIDLLVNRATIAHFTKDKFSSLKIPYPPISEQKEIATFIRDIEIKLSYITKDIKNQISKIKEYRESLIYEAVTGKIDVRDYATERQEAY
jgi:type I restriction enzyme S subunit